MFCIFQAVEADETTNQLTDFVLRLVGLRKPGSGNVLTPKYTVIILATIWLLMVACNSPYLGWMKVIYVPALKLHQCWISSAVSPADLQLFMIVPRFPNYYLPLALVWSAYLGIAMKMKMSSAKVKTTYMYMYIHFSNRIFTTKNTRTTELCVRLTVRWNRLCITIETNALVRIDLRRSHVFTQTNL